MGLLRNREGGWVKNKFKSKRRDITDHVRHNWILSKISPSVMPGIRWGLLVKFI